MRAPRDSVFFFPLDVSLLNQSTFHYRKSFGFLCSLNISTQSLLFEIGPHTFCFFLNKAGKKETECKREKQENLSAN